MREGGQDWDRPEEVQLVWACWKSQKILRELSGG